MDYFPHRNSRKGKSSSNCTVVVTFSVRLGETVALLPDFELDIPRIHEYLSKFVVKALELGCVSSSFVSWEKLSSFVANIHNGVFHVDKLKQEIERQSHHKKSN